MRTDEEMVIRVDKDPAARVEIARSFSFKLNVGNYESRDFFCSQKVECAAEDAERMSELIYDFCKHAVLKSVGEYHAERTARMETRKTAQKEVA